MNCLKKLEHIPCWTTSIGWLETQQIVNPQDCFRFTLISEIFYKFEGLEVSNLIGDGTPEATAEIIGPFEISVLSL